MLQFDVHPVRGDRLAGEPLLPRVHGPARHVGRLQRRQPLGAWLRAKGGLEHGHRDARAGCDERGAQITIDQRIGQHLQERAGRLQRTEIDGFEQRAEEQPLTVGALVEAVVRCAPERCAPERGARALDLGRRHGQRGAVQPADDDGLPAARARAFVQRGTGRDRHGIRLAVVGLGRDQVYGCARVRRLCSRDPGQRGEQVVRRGQRAPAAPFAVRRRPHVDEVVVQARQGRPVEAELLEAGRRCVEDRDISASDEPLRLGEVVGTG
jgi:hypothetical protein